jgi:hypothetical protein
MTTQPSHQDIIGVFSNPIRDRDHDPAPFCSPAAASFSRRGEALPELVMIGKNAHLARFRRQDEPTDANRRHGRAAGRDAEDAEGGQ